MKRVIFKLLSFILVAVVTTTIFASSQTHALTDLVNPVPIVDTTNAGYNIQRTMNLLETSTQLHKNTVKIAFYGQSITDPNNSWPVKLTDYLRDRYPNANIEYTNLAIGGYTTEKLSTMVADDMNGLYPDLVILYDFGSNMLYEKIVRCIKSITNAEIMLQTHHYRGPDLSADDTSYSFLPSLATKYKADLCQIRTPWKKYIDDYYAGDVKKLLSDDIHLNVLGQEFMLELMKQFFVYRTPGSTWKDPVTDFDVGSDVFWNNGKLELPFDGNRVELITGEGISATLNVKIDNKKPSEFLGCYSNPRIWKEGGVWSGGGHLMRAVMLKTPTDQTWTFKYTAFSSLYNRSSFKYQLSGTKTGHDGSGNSEGTFVSNSGQWSIFATDFCFFTPPEANVTQYTWKPILNGMDTYHTLNTLLPDQGSLALLASGLYNEKHTLTLTSEDNSNPSAIKTIRVYKPSVASAKLLKPKVKSVNTDSYFLRGASAPDAMVLAFYNSKQHITEAEGNGEFSLDLYSLKPGNTIKVKTLSYGMFSPETVIKIQPLCPSLSSVKTTSKYYTGRTYKGAKVYIKAAGKTKFIKANSKGKFSLRVWNKLKKNAKIQIWISINGVKSTQKSVTVK